MSDPRSMPNEYAARMAKKMAAEHDRGFRACNSHAADKLLEQAARISELEATIEKLTGCETTTDRVIENPASRHGGRDGRDT